MYETLLKKLQTSAPRYTSYPTAPSWGELSEEIYRKKLQALALSNEPLSLYFHLPFCQTMCLFCGCSVILNRKSENETIYVDFLIKEIEMIAKLLGPKKLVSQVHFGGGTPTKLSSELLERLYLKIASCFHCEGEIAIEIDPRTVDADQGEKLRLLKTLGFNRVSFGVQDTNEKVQSAIRRYQSAEVTIATYSLARELGFHEINLDLIYGLPFQTLETFKKTVELIVALKPDRIALFSYAKVPWLKPHQKAIKEETLPSTEEKFLIYVYAREAFIKNGYIAIGMDHFALQQSELALSYANKTLHRNFQGYTAQNPQALIGFGITSIGSLENCYVQNLKGLKEYYEAINQGTLPIFRGHELSLDDQLRKWVIEKLMCTFYVDKREFMSIFERDFDTYFSHAKEELDALAHEGLIINEAHELIVTAIGELFVRNVAMHFDGYLQKNQHQKFSQSI